MSHVSISGVICDSNVTRGDPLLSGALRRVLNRIGPASMIPKVFHQPHADYTKDAAISATFGRELEERFWTGPSWKRWPPTAMSTPLLLMRISPAQARDAGKVPIRRGTSATGPT